MFAIIKVYSNMMTDWVLFPDPLTYEDAQSKLAILNNVSTSVYRMPSKADLRETVLVLPNDQLAFNFGPHRGLHYGAVWSNTPGVYVNPSHATEQPGATKQGLVIHSNGIIAKEIVAANVGRACFAAVRTVLQHAANSAAGSIAVKRCHLVGNMETALYQKCREASVYLNKEYNDE